MVGGIFFTKAKGSNPRPDGPCRSYEYQYSGTMMYPITFYDVKRDEAGAVRIAYLEDDRNYENPKGPDMIIYTPRAEVLDGYMWHAYIRFQKNSISAIGSNAWPSEKLWAGIKAINAYIQSAIDTSTDADVIARQAYRDYRD